MVAKIFQVIFWTLLTLIVANLIFLDLKFFPKNDLGASTPEITATPTPSTDICPDACLGLIFEATATAQESVIPPRPTSVPKEQLPVSTVKEFFITFGGGSTTSREWTDMIGLEAYIDSSQYGSIKEVVFEAGINIPNGNQKALVRLFNVTDGHMVWNSEVSLEGGKPGLVISAPLTLSPGKKLYRVQIKTTVGDVAILTQSRIKITTQ